MLQWLPTPQSVRYTEGVFRWKDTIHAVLKTPCRDERLEEQAHVLFPELPLAMESGELYQLFAGKAQLLALHGKGSWERQEGYMLSVSEKGIVVQASSAAGLFYGMQTLAQARQQQEELPGMVIEDWPDFELRSAHYDLRQTHPPFEQLLSYIPVLASYKYNMLMIEYEDKFPFETHSNLRNTGYCLTEEQVRRLQQEAERCFMEILPLQQTFGHLEYVLKHSEYRHLRVTPENVGEMCPCHEDAYTLSCELLDEMARQHPNARYLHLGCDEVWSLGQCPHCKGSTNREKQFIAFVNRLAEHTVSIGKTPMIWHDMLMKCTDEELDMLDKRCVVVIWTYLPDGAGDIVREFAPRLAARGIQTLAAPAARCFDWKEIQNYPVLENRLQNIDDMVESAAKCGLNGMIVTNWTAAFSLGCPYGVYETTWYPMLYAVQAMWNRRAEKRDFLARFFRVFHGTELPQGEQNRHNADYFRIVAQYEQELIYNQGAAALIAMMMAYEQAMFELRVRYRYLYRLEIFSGEELETQCIKTRYEPAHACIEALREPFAQEIEKYLPAQMAELFVRSRFYLTDLLDKEIYAPLSSGEEE